MKDHCVRNGVLAALLALTAAAALAPAAAMGLHGSFYVVHNLVSDGGIPADQTDPNLVNAWGLARSATSPWWVADNETAVSTLYNGSGTPQSLVVNVPGAPTGTVFNGGTSFVITAGSASGPARFLFASEDGTISGWSPAVSPTQAVIAVTSAAGAIYKGLAIATTPAGAFLYAADFHNARVD